MLKKLEFESPLLAGWLNVAAFPAYHPGGILVFISSQRPMAQGLGVT